MLPQVSYGQCPHCAREFGVHGLLCKGPQPSDEGGRFGGVRVGRLVRSFQVTREDVLGGELKETGRDVLDLPPQLPQVAGDRGKRDPGRVQLGGHGKFLGARHEEEAVVAGYRLQYAELHRLGDRGLVGGAAEAGVQLGAGDPDGLLVGPRAVDLGDKTEDAAEATAGVVGLQELLDGGQAVAAVEEIGDLAQPDEVGVGVDVGPAAALGAGSSPRS